MSTYRLPIAIIAGGLIIALAVYLTVHTASAPVVSGNPSLVRAVDPTDHVLGNPAAPVKIIEYSDYDCSFCKDFDATMHKIITDYGASGKVAWVYRNYPIPALHPNAYKAAVAAECVAQVAGNDAYWRFGDALFTNQPVDPLSYAQYVRSAGANADAVATCEQNASTTVAARIESDAQNAKDIGAPGTPYSVIVVAGKSPVVMGGAYPYDGVVSAISQALSQ